MFKKQMYLVCTEVVLLGVGLLTFPDWIANNPHYVILAGIVPLLLLLTFDHWPRAISFYSSLIWPGAEKSSRIFRDYLSLQSNKTAVMRFDKQASEYYGVKGSTNSLLSAFHFWLVAGINAGVLEVYGRAKNGTKVERISGKPAKGIADENIDIIRERPELLLMENGEIYTDIQIRKSTLKSFANFIGNADWSDYDNT